MTFKSSNQTKTPFTQTAVARIMSSTALKTNGKVSKGSFAAKAQSNAAKNNSQR